jgi:DNA-binding LacI/PurR family transcriptional regulator
MSRVSLSDVARTAGVHRTAVGKVLHGAGSTVKVGEAKARLIREVAERLGYVPHQAAQQLRGAPSGLIGIVSAIDNNPMRLITLRELQRAAGRAGLSCVVGQAENAGEAQSHLRRFESLRTQAVLVAGPAAAGWVRPETYGQPTVYAGDIPESLTQESSQQTGGKDGLTRLSGANRRRGRIVRVCGVETDRRLAVRLAVEHLIEQGRKRVGLAIVGWPGRASNEKVQGYREAATGLRGFGTQGWVYSALPDSEAKAHISDLLDVLIKRHRCDAIVASNDRLAAMVMKSLVARGLEVPGDIAVVGMENRDLCETTTPELTSVDFDSASIATEAIAVIRQWCDSDAQAQKSPTPRIIHVTPKLISRSSSCVRS